ncbi:MAG: hypothetical protein KHZ29_07535 [Desulfovibrionaceae bacterium]|nr:hypothetical protein [Desulfovibrionaceae bacterium]
MEHVKSFCESREERDDAKDNARECMELTHAVCILMAADPHLSPDDAVNDVYQIYDHIRSRRR